MHLDSVTIVKIIIIVLAVCSGGRSNDDYSPVTAVNEDGDDSQSKTISCSCQSRRTWICSFPKNRCIATRCPVVDLQICARIKLHLSNDAADAAICNSVCSTDGSLSCQEIDENGNCENCDVFTCNVSASMKQPPTTTTTATTTGRTSSSTKTQSTNSTILTYTYSSITTESTVNNTSNNTSIATESMDYNSSKNKQDVNSVIIGSVVGGVLAIALILIAAFLILRYVRRRKRASAQGMTNMTNGYQHMPTGAPKTPVAPYDNLMNTPPGEQNPEPAQQMGPGFNDNLNGETSYDNAGGRVNNYDEIRVHEYVEITDGGDVVTGPSGRVSLFGAVAPPGESGETTLLDNEFYGDSAPNVRSRNENEGETTVIDNDFYE